MSAHHDDDALPPGRFRFSDWRDLWKYLRPYRGNGALLLLLGAVCAVFDALIPWANGHLIDMVSRRAEPSAVATGFAIYCVLMAAFTVTIWGLIRTAGTITTGLAYDLRRAGFAQLQSLSFSFYDKKAVGWLMARMTSDISTLSRVMSWSFLDIGWGSSVLPACAIAMLLLNWKLALLVLATWPVLIVVSLYFQSRILKVSRLQRKANSATTAAFNEGLQGARTTKSMGREDKNLAEFKVLTDTMYGLSLRNAMYAAVYVPVLTTVCFLGVAIALYAGGYMVAVQKAAEAGGFTVGSLFAFIQYATFIQFPMQQLGTSLTNIQSAQASVERVKSLLDTRPAIADRPEVAARPPESLPAHIATLEFRNVSFGYDPAHPVLHDFNLTLRQGQSVALVGPTGGGKSTIVSLACRFYEPTAGQVLVNGTDYRDLPLAWLQSRLGMVLQQPHLFSGTVLENIRYGRLSATDADIETAARLAGAHDFITALPDGYNARVGEGGNRLSTGQKQLVSLARAIIADPAVFVMDEATSSVDTATERAIQSAVDRVLRGRISFVIAHRLSTIRRADLILVVSGGRVVEQGDHHQLLARRGRYYELYTNQFTHEHEDELVAGGAA